MQRLDYLRQAVEKLYTAHNPEANTWIDYAVFKNWMREKLEKDFTKKFFFEDVKEEIRPRYEALKLVFLNDL